MTGKIRKAAKRVKEAKAKFTEAQKNSAVLLAAHYRKQGFRDYVNKAAAETKISKSSISKWLKESDIRVVPMSSHDLRGLPTIVAEPAEEWNCNGNEASLIEENKILLKILGTDDPAETNNLLWDLVNKKISS